MMFKLASFAVSLLLAVSVFADPSFSCGNNPTTDELLAAEKKFVLPDAASPSRRSGDAAEAVTINVYFHVIAKDNTVAGGNIPDALIQQQMNVLNQDYSRIPTGLSWRLVSVDRTIRPLWATSLTDGSPQEQQMKRTLRKGGPADLNVYTVLSIGGAPPGYLIDGYATFPWDFSSRPWNDGIVLSNYAMPGGPYPARNLGRTLSHEAGHWLGLYHTFQGGCTAPGDSVDDTPYQQSPASGCPWGRDTCSQPGRDAITNYMDYTDDFCRTNLTPGQISRAVQALRRFRGV